MDIFFVFNISSSARQFTFPYDTNTFDPGQAYRTALSSPVTMTKTLEDRPDLT